MKDEKDKWSWQVHVNTYFPSLIFIATIIVTAMIITAYLWVH